MVTDYQLHFEIIINYVLFKIFWNYFCCILVQSKKSSMLNFFPAIKINHILFIFIWLQSIIGVLAQDIVLPPYYIKSIQLTSSDGNGFNPIIPKNGRINIQFDDLEANEKDYYYLLEHCDKNWKTSDLLPTEFVRGFQKEQITDYRNSFNTLQHFTHYSLNLPNEKTQFIISGNYRLSILNDDDEVQFTRYFIVYEPITTVGVSIHRSREVSFIGSQQSVQFSINHNGLTINNPSEEIYALILQNFDFNAQITGLKPQFMRSNQLLYKYDKETAFWGGNEYLNFDTKDLLMHNIHVAKVVSGNPLYESILYTDLPRAYDPYTYFPDVNGNFLVRNARREDAAIESDYSWVNFSLNISEMFDKKVYVYGGFNNFQLTDENRMVYNELTENYTAKILLKQGFYNYTYAILDAKNQLNLGKINGNFEKTENEYHVIVYYTKFGSRYDRVIGYGVGSSLKMNQ